MMAGQTGNTLDGEGPEKYHPVLYPQITPNRLGNPRNRAAAKVSPHLGKAAREREHLLSRHDRSRSASPLTQKRPAPATPPTTSSPTPSPSPLIPPQPDHDQGAPSALLKLTIHATSGPGAPRRTINVEAEGRQTLDELCFQAHPSVLLSRSPASFVIKCRGNMWYSLRNGSSSLASLGFADGDVIEVDTEGIPGPTNPSSPTASPHHTSLASPSLKPTLTSPLSPSRRGAETTATHPDANEVVKVAPAPLPATVPEVPQGDTTHPSISPAPARSRSRRDTLQVTIVAKDRYVTTTHSCELPPGEKLLTTCRRCNLTEPYVPARNTAYRGFLVTCRDSSWNTKTHGRSNLRELGVECGDELVVEVDWGNVRSHQQREVKPRKKAAPPPQQRPIQSPPPSSDSPRPPPPPQSPNPTPTYHPISPCPPSPHLSPPRGIVQCSLLGKGSLSPVVAETQAATADMHRTKVAEYHKEKQSRRAPHVSPPRGYRELAGLPEPPPPAILESRRESPHRRAPLPSPPDALSLSPTRDPFAPRFVGPVSALSPRRSKGVSEEVAWNSFVATLSAVLTEQDLILVSSDTIRDLIRHYGFDKDPVLAAKIELHWKRLTSGRRQQEDTAVDDTPCRRTPPARSPPSRALSEKHSPRKKKAPPHDSRHVPHIEKIWPNGKPTGGKRALSPEAHHRIERGQAKRWELEKERQDRQVSAPAPLPFGGGIAETPSEGPIGRRLHQEVSMGRKRAVSPPATPSAHSDRRQQCRPQSPAAGCNPNSATDSANESYHLYSKELRSIEYSEMKEKQALVAPGKKLHVRDKNERVGGEKEQALMTRNGLVSPGGRSKAAAATPAASCNPNPREDPSGRREGKCMTAAPDKVSAHADPNSCTEKMPQLPGVTHFQSGHSSLKCLSVGPERSAATCNPNSAGGEAAKAASERKASVHSSTSASQCNPNTVVYHCEGERRHMAAEAISRKEGDRFFHPDNRAIAEANPNTIVKGADGSDRQRYSRKAVAEFSPKQHSSLQAVPGGQGEKTHLLQGPAGVAGTFSPGLAPPVVHASPVARNRPPAHANPNQMTSESTDHITPHPKGKLGGPNPPSKRQTVAAPATPNGVSASDPNNTPGSFQSPRSGGRRRLATHPAAMENNIAALMRNEE